MLVKLVRLLPVMFYSAVVLWVLAFIFPVGFYPFQDFTRDYLTAFAALLLFSDVFWQRNSAISFSQSFIFLILGLVGLLVSYLATSPSVPISYNMYLIAFLTCAWVSLSVTELKSVYSQEIIIDRFASLILLVSILGGLVGLLRYYGVLKYIIPVISEDGSRFLGPFGQPNLTAILMAIGLSAVLFLKSKRDALGSISFYITLCYLIYCGTLTGSRAWFVVVFAVLLLWLFFYFNLNSDDKLKKKWFRGHLLVSTCLFFVAIWAVPIFDAIVSEPLIESGYINRVSAETMYSQREMAGSSGRFDEWKKVVEAEAFDDKLWTGYGAGRYGVFSNEVALNNQLQGNGQIWNNAHNIFVNFFIEFGLLGLFFIISFYFYILIMVMKSEKNEPSIFLISIISIFVLHSLVEFSLWSFPFLATFLVAISLLDNSHRFNFSDHKIKRVIVLFFLIVFLPFGYYVGRDALIVVDVMFKQAPKLSDRIALDDVLRSSIVGDKAASVLILKFQPPTLGLEHALAQMEKLSDWRPEPLFLLRKSSLLAATGRYEKACLSITNSIKVYPIALTPIQKELSFFAENLDMNSHLYNECIFRGVGNWVK